MNRHTRFIPALLVLIALALSLAEGVWAATCVPGMEMSEMAMAGMEHTPAQDGDAPRPDENSSECPFGPVSGAQSCALAALLPDRAVMMSPPAPEDAALSKTVETSPHLLRAASIFHPPKP